MKLTIFALLLLIGSTSVFARSNSARYIEKRVKIDQIYDLHDIELEIIDHLIPTRAYIRVSKNRRVLGHYQTTNFDTSRLLRRVKAKILRFKNQNPNAQVNLVLGSKVSGVFNINEFVLFQ